MHCVLGTPYRGLLIGDLSNLQHHGVSGTVYALNDSLLLVRQFTYDGNGPGAVFLIGHDGEETPSRKGTILPYPFDGT